MQFLCIIPKHDRSKFPEDTSIRESVRRLQTKVTSAYKGFISDAYTAPSHTVPSSHAKAFLSVWDRGGETTGSSFHSGGDTWVACSGQRVADHIHRSMKVTGGVLRYSKPVWGSYTAVFGERYMDRVTAWGTTPALEAIHHSENSQYVFLANSPLLVAIARAYGVVGDIKLSDEYLAEYLGYGYSISGRTPFSEVYTVPTGSAISVIKGQIRFSHVPPGLDARIAPDHSLTEGADALASALIGAMDRTEEQIRGKTLQVRLSGGKDSRLLLGLLKGRDIDAYAVTYGVNSDNEVRLAREIAEMSSMPHWVGAPATAAGASTVEEQSLRTIYECGGIPPSEPHLLTSIGANPRELNDAVMLGQWPLFKGGLAKVVRYPEGGVVRALHNQVAPLLDPEVRDTYTERLTRWANEVHASSELERLYLFAREFRSGRYLHSHIAHYSRDAIIAYPISDSEVTAVSDTLTMYEKVSQKTLFLALQRIWPEALTLPLHNSDWRFEASGPADISGQHYSKRKQTQQVASTKIDVAQPIDGAAPNAYSPEMVSDLCNTILISPYWCRISELLSEPMRQAVSSSAEHGSGWNFQKALPDTSSKEFAKWVWRVYAADLWKSRRWLALGTKNGGLSLGSQINTEAGGIN